MREFDAWSFCRDVLSRGAAVERDAAAAGCGYETFSARMDAAAREMGDRLKPHLAEYPADDGEAVTEEWLLSIGARKGDSTLARKLYLGEVNFDDVARGVVSVCDWSENAVLGQHFTTRGAVRRLLAALGIKVIA